MAQYEAALTAAEAMGYRAVPETPIFNPAQAPAGRRDAWACGWTGCCCGDDTHQEPHPLYPDGGLWLCPAGLRPGPLCGEELSDHNAVCAACRMGEATRTESTWRAAAAGSRFCRRRL
ncbi:MAG: hypothetical protein ACLTG0_08610 [Oscillibacter sp.]